LLLLAVGIVCGQENVLHLTASNFDQAIQDHAFLAVQFFAPWCSHCKTLAPEWEKAATRLKGDPSAVLHGIALAAVDATVENSLAEKFQIAGYPSIKIFEGHSTENPSTYDGPREADGIFTFLQSRVASASSELTTAAEVESLKSSGHVFVVNTNKVEEWWLNLAKSKRHVVQWCHTTNAVVMEALGVEADTIVMIKDFDDVNPLFKGNANSSNVQEIIEFVDYHRIPVAIHLKHNDEHWLQVVFEPEENPNIFLFTNSRDVGLVDFTMAVQSVRGKMVSARFHDSEFADAFQHFGMNQYIGESTLPKVLIEDRKNKLKFLLEGDVNEASIKQFIVDFMNEDLEPFVKSDPDPEHNSGPVKVIVGEMHASPSL